MPPLAITLIVRDIGMKKMKERSETSNWIVDHFSLIFVNLSLAYLLYFHVWLQNKEKTLYLESIYTNQFGIYQKFECNLLRTAAKQVM